MKHLLLLLSLMATLAYGQNTITLQGNNVNYTDKITTIVVLANDRDTVQMYKVKRGKQFSITVDSSDSYTVVFYNGEHTAKRVYVNGHRDVGAEDETLKVTIDWDNPDYLADVSYSFRHDKYYMTKKKPKYASKGAQTVIQ